MTKGFLSKETKDKSTCPLSFSNCLPKLGFKRVASPYNILFRISITVVILSLRYALNLILL